MRIAAETLFFFILLYFIFGYPHDFALSEDRGFIFVGLSIGRRRGERFGCRYNVHVYGLLSLPHHFASTTPKNMAMAGRLSGLLVQAFRELGKENVTLERLKHLKRTIPLNARKELLKDIRFAPEWMHSIFKELAEEA